jgi:hypothetical protein
MFEPGSPEQILPQLIDMLEIPFKVLVEDAAYVVRSNDTDITDSHIGILANVSSSIDIFIH